jgi:hypothetical protein
MIDADALFRKVKTECNPYGKPTIGFEDGKRVLNWIEQAPTVGGWISVKDRMPEERENPYTKDYQEVLCVLSTRFGSDVRVYKFGKGHFWNGPKEIDRFISHWMPFPELPKEEER